MKNPNPSGLLFFFLFHLIPIFGWAQVPVVLNNPSNCGLGLSITDNNCPDDSPFYQPDIFIIQVNNAPGDTLGRDVYLREVRLIIRHTWVNDLDITLVSPGGRSAVLTADNGGGDDNFGVPDDSTCDSAAVFSIGACLAVQDAAAPFTLAPVRPEESFYVFNDSITDPNGFWELIICDDFAGDVGTLEFVELVFEPLSCLPVSELEIVQADTTSVLLNWAPDNFCGTTVIEYGPEGFTPGTGASPGNGSGMVTFVGCPPFELSGLTEETEYDLYVRRFCPASGSFSENSCPVSVLTGCQLPALRIEETFDLQPPCTSPVCGVTCDLTGLWRNGPHADFDWILYNGSTPTQGTGPAADVNGNANYVYLETTGSTCAVGGRAHLLSPCIQLDKMGSDSCHFSFNYHMYGTSVGTLRLQVSLDGGFSWSTRWQKSGNQGNQWHKEYLSFRDLPDGAVLQFRFVGIKGNGFRGDIALDHLVFYGAQNLGFPDRKFYVDADEDGFGQDGPFVLSCLESPPAGYTDNNLDCDDADPMVNPDAPEIPCDGIDNNCNGSLDDTLIPPPVGISDTICSGESALICAGPVSGFSIIWYEDPLGISGLSIGNCFAPELPENNTPAPVVYRFYAQETNFTSCFSAQLTEVQVVVNPRPAGMIDEVPAICPNESLDLAGLNITDANFTGGVLSFHNGSPATTANELPGTVVSPTQSTTFYYLITSPEGCTGEGPVFVEVKPGPSLTFSPSDSFSLCREGLQTVAVTASGGQSPYSYFWSTGASGPSTDVKAAFVAGTVDDYFVTVTDSEGCFSVGNLKLTTTNSIDSLRRIVNNVTTCSGSDGSIALIPLNGLSPFTYQWTGSNGQSGSITSAADTVVIGGLAQGSYRITITDSSDEQCEFLLRNVLVQGPAAVVNATNITPVSCAGASDGSICLDVMGNAPRYLWSTGDTTSCIFQLPGGNYSVTITDGPCETVLRDMQVEEPGLLALRASFKNPSCYNAADGSINVIVFDGTPPYRYSWSNGKSTPGISGLMAGTYRLTLEDDRGCSRIDTFFLQAPDTLRLGLDSLSAISCHGQKDGFIRVAGQGGKAPYRYRWNTGSTSPVLFNLGPGAYSVTLTDFNGCMESLSIPVSDPQPLTLALAGKTNPLCRGDETGQIEVLASGGTPPYTYAWSNGATGSLVQNLGIGSYQVVAIDAKGCRSDALSVVLTPEINLNLVVDIQAPPCVGPENGSITLTPTGVGPFSYLWSSGSTGNILSGIGGGTYPVVITDGQGCRYDTSIVVETPQVFDIDLVVETNTCFGVNDGIINVIFASSGTPPFNFLWNDGETQKDRTDLAPGDYYLIIEDAIGCRLGSDTVVLSYPDPLMLAGFDQGNVACSGDSTGYVEVVVGGGTAPYFLNWIGIGSGTSGIYDLAAGSYRLQVTDSRNCPIDTTFVISEPGPLNLEVDLSRGERCDPIAADTLIAIALGGVPPYTYQWNDGAQGAERAGIPSGDYQVTVTDANGCTAVHPSIKVSESIRAIRLDTFFVENFTCFGANDAKMTAQISGGSGRYSYLFSPTHFFPDTSATRITIAGLTLHNHYSVTVTDLETGCRTESPKLTITPPQPLSIDLDQIVSVPCFGGIDGGIFVTVTGGTLPYRFTWRDSLGQVVGTQEDLRLVPSGMYFLEVADAKDCVASFSDNIPESNPLIRLVDTLVQPVACFQGLTGGIDISVAGGKPPYAYLWSNGALTQDISNVAAGNYSLTITDADTCKVIFPQLIIPGTDSPILVNGITQDLECFGDTDGAISVAVSGGEAPYVLRWFANGQLIVGAGGNSLFNLPAGNYALMVRDARQCQKSFPFEISSPEELVVDIAFTPPGPPDYNNGRAVAVVSGGLGPYSYTWSTGDTTSVADGLAPGLYSVTVSDGNECQAENSLNLVQVLDRVLLAGARLYPNPGSGRVVLDLALQRPVPLELFIADAWGRQWNSRTLDQAGEHSLVLDLGAYPPGLYWVILKSEGKTIYTDRLVVIRP